MSSLQVRSAGFSTNDICRILNRAEHQLVSTDSFLQDVQEKRKRVAEEIRALQEGLVTTRSSANCLQETLTGLMADADMLRGEVCLKEEEVQQLETAVEKLKSERRSAEGLLKHQREEHLRHCRELSLRRQTDFPKVTWLVKETGGDSSAAL